MRVAYLFVEKFPNYDLDFQLLVQVKPLELQTLDTYVRTGLWGFTWRYRHSGRVSDETIEKDLVNLFLTGDGNVTRPVKADKIINAIRSEQIYTIQFYSLGRDLALSLHERLSAREDYLGFTQVLPQVSMHRQVFDDCGPRYRIERGKIYVLFSPDASDNEWHADEIIDWLKQHYTRLEHSHIVSAIAKRDMGWRFTMMDSSEMSGPNIPRAIEILRDAWESQSEQTVYRMEDAVPDALEEFAAAVDVLSKPDLTSADCAQIAVNLRRAIEKVTDIYCPTTQKTPGWVQRQWKQFFEEKFADRKEYGDYLTTEVVGLDERLDRLQKAYKMGHKGVHEDWEPMIFRSFVLRMVLFMFELLSLRAKRTIKIDPGLLYEMFDDSAGEL